MGAASAKGATGTLFVDGVPVAERRIPQTMAILSAAPRTTSLR
jgi:hypothetical protein